MVILIEKQKADDEVHYPYKPKNSFRKTHFQISDLNDNEVQCYISYEPCRIQDSDLRSFNFHPMNITWQMRPKLTLKLASIM